MELMDDDAMQLEELARLKEYARDGMAKDMRKEMGLDKEPDEDIQPVPGAEPDGAMAEGEPDGDEAAGGKMSPEILQAILLKLRGG